MFLGLERLYSPAAAGLCQQERCRSHSTAAGLLSFLTQASSRPTHVEMQSNSASVQHRTGQTSRAHASKATCLSKLHGSKDLITRLPTLWRLGSVYCVSDTRCVGYAVHGSKLDPGVSNCTPRTRIKRHYASELDKYTTSPQEDQQVLEAGVRASRACALLFLLMLLVAVSAL